uniref:RWD domain-containing protein n=1 Tax=Amphimedon queenslandica TaxID=400682 RepID=A0A1X7SFH2_AMPQE
MATGLSSKEFVENELKDVRSDPKLSSLEFIACHKVLVQVRIKYTEYKNIIVNIQFPPEYPANPLLLQIKSKVLPDKLIEKIETLCDQELKKLVGSKQVSTILLFLCDFIKNNPLIVCSEELQYIKNTINREGDELKIKQKTGVILYKAAQDQLQDDSSK